MEYYCFDENSTSETFASKSIPAAKFQNSADISGAQKPTWVKFLEFDFFIWKGKAIYKNPLGVNLSSCINLSIKLLIKVVNSQKKNEILYFLGSSISVLLQIGSSSFQAP